MLDLSPPRWSHHDCLLVLMRSEKRKRCRPLAKAAQTARKSGADRSQADESSSSSSSSSPSSSSACERSAPLLRTDRTAFASGLHRFCERSAPLLRAVCTAFISMSTSTQAGSEPPQRNCRPRAATHSLPTERVRSHSQPDEHKVTDHDINSDTVSKCNGAHCIAILLFRHLLAHCYA